MGSVNEQNMLNNILCYQDGFIIHDIGVMNKFLSRFTTKRSLRWPSFEIIPHKECNFPSIFNDFGQIISNELWTPAGSDFYMMF